MNTIKVKDSGDDNFGQYDYIYNIDLKIPLNDFQNKFDECKNEIEEDLDDGEISNENIFLKMQNKGYIGIFDDLEIDLTIIN